MHAGVDGSNAARLDIDIDLVSVVLCTTASRPALADCIASLIQLDDTRHEIIVVQNRRDAIADLVDCERDNVRVVHEPRRGLDVARNRGIREARGSIVAFVDDDCIADPAWLAGLRRAFADPEVAFVAGRAPAWKLDCRSERCFERMFGFDRGDLPLEFDRTSPQPWLLVAPGAIGTGCNMAFRRCVFDQCGGFDEALDMGTLITGGGDLDMFARVLRAGLRGRYSPDAVVFHRHRTEMVELAWQVWGYGLSQGAVAVKAWRCDAPSRAQAPGFVRWRVANAVRRGLAAIRGHELGPALMSVLELAGIVCGLVVYPVAALLGRANRGQALRNRT
jgi:GT2 family glycosyltransferase